jgi:hypothetical protein
MAEAAPVIRAVLPDANVPTSIRSTGEPVVRGRRSDLRRLVEEWSTTHEDGTACVVSVDRPRTVEEGLMAAFPRLRWLHPHLVKGLEFDLVVLVDPCGFGVGVAGAVDRYVAMTRATSRLVVLTSA